MFGYFKGRSTLGNWGTRDCILGYLVIIDGVYTQIPEEIDRSE